MLLNTGIDRLIISL